MKYINMLLAIFLLIMAGCEGNNRVVDDLIKVDVTKGYSEKEELILQDFMDVEYIPLETKDDFLNQGFIQAIGKNIILVKNWNDNGDIFVYDRTGKAIRKINRKGQGSEEYVFMYNITLDEDRGEMFINDLYAKKIIVYDLYGNFKRSFKHKEGGGSIFYVDIYNYDKECLICFDEYNEEAPFVLISKEDGRVIKEIKIPFKEKKYLRHNSADISVSPGSIRSMIYYKENWILSELSSDTIYTFMPDHSLHPFIVRTPSIQSMDPEVMLVLRSITDRYYFMETIMNTFDFSKNTGFKRSFFMYDRQKKTICNYALYNGDYSIEKEIYLNFLRPVNNEVETSQSLAAHELVSSYEKGELKGRLKEIAAKLDPEDNPVIMLIKYKK